MVNLSIVVPGIRVKNWLDFYKSAEKSCNTIAWEMIFVGPVDAPSWFEQKENIKFIKDFGHPSRCAQMGTALASGEYVFNAACDDGLFLPGAVEKAFIALRSAEESDNCYNYHGMCMRYREGVDFSGATQPLDYWRARFGADMRLMSITDDMWIAPMIMMKTEDFRWFGGWDCRFEHLNLNTHDLAIRIYKAGGKIHLSPEDVVNQDWIPTGEGPVRRAYEENDYPLFKDMYDIVITEDQWQERIRIPYDNWKSASPRWQRRFGFKARTYGPYLYRFRIFCGKILPFAQKWGSYLVWKIRRQPATIPRSFKRIYRLLKG